MDLLLSLDWAALIKIIGIDIMLGVDNAIVIALAVAGLSPELRKKAVFWGTAGAVGLRAVLLVFAGFLISIPYIKLIAGAYLVYIGYKLLNAEEEAHNISAADRVTTAVKTILVADFMMSLDNVLAVAGAAQGAGAHSTWYAIAGIVLTIPIIIYGAALLAGVMERFPIIVWVGAGLLGWVGMEMVVTDPALAAVSFFHSSMGPLTHTFLKAAGFSMVVFAAWAVRSITEKAKQANPQAI